MSNLTTFTTLPKNQQMIQGIPIGKLNNLDQRVSKLEKGGGGSGITSINGDTTATQTLTVGTSGTDFAVVDNGTGDHKFNLPTASHTNRGALSSADWDTFNGKISSVTGLNTDNTDPQNPIVKISVDGVTITGQGTPGDPLVSVGGGSSYTFSDSLVNTAGTVTLVNDNATPGNSYYYGTNSSGTKGFFILPSAGSSPWTLDGNNNLYTSNTGASFNGTNGFFAGVAAGAGGNAGGAHSIAIGGSALHEIAAGVANIALGVNSLYNVLAGNDNIGIGQAAGYNITSGSRNITMGVNVEAVSATANEQLNIGNLIYATGLYDGGAGHSSTPVAGQVGIGVVPTSVMFEVAGTAKFSSDTTVNGALNVSSDTALAQASGKVTVGTPIGTPAQLFNVYGDMYLYGGLLDSSGNIGTSGYLLSSTGGSTAWVPAPTSPWTLDGSGNTYNSNTSASVMIGFSGPANATLDVHGNIRSNGGVFVDGGYLYTLGASGGNTLKFGNTTSGPTPTGPFTTTNYIGNNNYLLTDPDVFFLVEDTNAFGYAIAGWRVY